MQELTSISAAIDAFKAGQFVIVVDDEDRENEGDLILAAEHMTEEKMAFIIRYTGGVVCMPLTNDIADHLHLPPMVLSNTSQFKTAFTVSIEAAKGVTTGISAHDRAATVLAVANPNVTEKDIRRPGHIFPLRAQDGGVLLRAGHTEATIDLCKMADLRTVGVLSELMHDNGTMMRLPALKEFAEAHTLPIISIADMIAWRRTRETLVQKQAETTLETDTGTWTLQVYRDELAQLDHMLLTQGNMRSGEAVLVRVHSECVTGDVFGSHHCDCGVQLETAMKQIQDNGSGAVLYLRQEGRGIGLTNKIRAYELQSKEGLDTVQANERLGFPADVRDYGIGAQILKDAGIEKMKLLTNNPKKMIGLEGYGLEITEQLPIEVQPTSDMQRRYLQTKKDKLGHLIRHL